MRMKGIGRCFVLAGMLFLLFANGYGQDSIGLGELANDSVVNLAVTDSAAGLASVDSIAPDSLALAAAVMDSLAADSLDTAEKGFFEMVRDLPFRVYYILIFVLLILTALFAWMFIAMERMYTGQAKALEKELGKEKEIEGFSRSAKNIRIVRKIFIVGMLVFIVGLWVSQLIKGTTWEGHVNEWLNLIVRWTHVTFGVAWIGTSFYFIFLENALFRGPGIREGLAGNLWAIHGGGFYYVEKFKVAPEKLPKHLHWFKWEAYITWLSGFSLLFVVYYFNAGSVLVDKSVADISNGAAIALGISTIVGSWFVYDILCKSPLVEKKRLFFFIMLGFLVFVAYFLSQWLSPKAAYLHTGAVIGTMMAGNVWRVIIPSQKAMVQAAKENKPVNPELGRHAGLRSLHNNYFTLPILFIMVSNHFPSTFGHTLNWVVLGALTLISAGVKHYFNLKDKGEKNPFLIPAAALGMFLVFMFTSPQMNSESPSEEDSQEEVEFYQVYQVMTRRCASCHSEKPIDDENVIAPNGVMFDTPEQILANKDEIYTRAVVTKTMPQNNKTGMTDAERNLIKRWVEQGAKGF